MPHFHIEGADRYTGEERITTITAASSVEAENLANDQGLLISRLYEVEQREKVGIEVEEFLAIKPQAHHLIEAMTDAQKARSFWISGVESTESLRRIQVKIGEYLDPRKADGLSVRNFIEFAQADPAIDFSEVELDSVLRTNLAKAQSARTYAELTSAALLPHIPLFILDEIQDRRTRGNPNGLYPKAAPHYQMDGFIARPSDPVWKIIWPPNGYQCRASVAPVSWNMAEDEGWADEDCNLIQSAIDAHNGERWEFIRSGRYPDKGFLGGPASMYFSDSHGDQP